FLVFRDYYKKNKTKLHLSNFCKRDRLCPFCAVRRATKQQNKFLEIYEHLDNKSPDWFYIVLPVRHTAKESFEVVFDRVNRLKSMISKSIRDKTMNNFFSSFLGGMYSIETTKTSNGWNIHLNLLINAKNGSKIDLMPIINKRGQVSYQNADLGHFMRLYADDSLMHNIQKLDFTTPEAQKDALLEVLKYSLKFSSLTNQELIHFFVFTKGKRLFGTFGSLWGLGLEDVDLNKDDVVDNEFLEIMIRKIAGTYELFSIQKKDLLIESEKLSKKSV
ncbi:MAG: protein rep, partial [Epsilonproteobacteria bacterium]|nr:protein rep [Campylobacterota bacterium]